MEFRPFDILGLNMAAFQAAGPARRSEILKAAYRKAVQKTHTDRAENGMSHDGVASVNRARDILNNPDQLAYCLQKNGFFSDNGFQFHELNTPPQEAEPPKQEPHFRTPGQAVSDTNPPESHPSQDTAWQAMLQAFDQLCEQFDRVFPNHDGPIPDHQRVEPDCTGLFEAQGESAISQARQTLADLEEQATHLYGLYGLFQTKLIGNLRNDITRIVQAMQKERAQTREKASQIGHMLLACRDYLPQTIGPMTPIHAEYNLEWLSPVAMQHGDIRGEGYMTPIIAMTLHHCPEYKMIIEGVLKGHVCGYVSLSSLQHSLSNPMLQNMIHGFNDVDQRYEHALFVAQQKVHGLNSMPIGFEDNKNKIAAMTVTPDTTSWNMQQLSMLIEIRQTQLEAMTQDLKNWTDAAQQIMPGLEAQLNGIMNDQQPAQQQNRQAAPQNHHTM